MSTEFYWTAVAVVTVISAARITRVVTFDAFPPARWVRNLWGDTMDRTKATRGYAVLFFCQWCFSFYPTLGIILWGYYTQFGDLWWLVNGAFAASYLAAIFMTNDTDNRDNSEPDDDDEEDES